MKDEGSVPRRPVERRQNVVRSLTLALAGLAATFWWFQPHRVEINAGSETPVHPVSGFTWGQITPSESLEYHDCFDGFQCARLLVPMDYHRSDGKGRQFALAITRLPAKVPVTDPRYGGPILVNPGGPGGSGVTQVRVSGHNLQAIADAESEPRLGSEWDDGGDKYFDIIGFDPRAVGNTTPGFSCFPDTFSLHNWRLQTQADGMLGSSPDSLMRNWQRVTALTDSCSDRILAAEEGEDALGEHVNTPPVARDMLEIVERHAEWREQRGLAAQRILDSQHGYDEEQAIVARTRWNRGRETLLYWGRSYGTVIGATFASLYPDRVARAVLDGVVDSNLYYHNDGQGDGKSNVLDADAIFRRFAYYCDSIGPDACPFYQPGGPAAIEAAYWALEARLLADSLPVHASATRGPEVITWTDLKIIVRIAMYQPLRVFPLLARILGELAVGNGSSLAEFKQQRHGVPSCLSDECRRMGPWSSACLVPELSEDFSTQAILCTDAAHLGQIDRQGFLHHWHNLTRDSKIVGDYWSHTRLDCVGWKAKAKWSFEGPPIGETAHPLLFVSNTLDPVTPLTSARRMSEGFPGSVVLEQDSEGHTTLAAPSLCIAKAIRTYFQTGELPDPDTLCVADLKPLLGAPTHSADTMSVEDRKLFDILLDEVHKSSFFV
ncbi:hypothetical protein ASPZODRAFT_23025 [Penicilliopsis zonata CBS 506.65]|uniref:Peptidase S33 tripeptidyl aminopeptidase-like C-terminal domain-containing protein n=1 Tax=Penicilliopsis zonata CBS 506.65 TaxID=1073090 RepID=A0A1L9ST41_9EURO|nr:hypothetical protein ASPZODRAFT_23025 [Penicilliopsis zonata CBS 506.65]OJJ50378.1 hypothetical protein ASPZODRAFT_23025 [Penicilliopsis zonata CBS 506.65]